MRAPPCKEGDYALKKYSDTFSNTPRGETERHTSQLLSRVKQIEQALDPGNFLSSELDDVDTLNSRPPPRWRETRRLQFATVGSGYSPKRYAAVSIRGDAEGMFKDVFKIRKGHPDRFGEGPDRLAAQSGWVQHAQVVPFDVLGKHGEKIV